MSSIFGRVKDFLVGKFSALRDRFINVTEEETDSGYSQSKKRRNFSGEGSELPAKRRAVLMEQNNPVMKQGPSRGQSFQPEVVTLDEDEEDDEVLCVKDNRQTTLPDQDIQLLSSSKVPDTYKMGKIKKKRLWRSSLAKRKFRATYNLLFPSDTPSQIRHRDTGRRIEEHEKFSEILRQFQAYETPSLPETAASTSRTQSIFRSAQSVPSSRPTSSTLIRRHYHSRALSAEETAELKRNLMLKSPFSCTTSTNSVTGTTLGSSSEATSKCSSEATSKRSSAMTPKFSSGETSTPSSDATPGPSSRVPAETKEAHAVDVESDDETELEGAAAISTLTPVHDEEWVRKLIEENNKSSRERKWKIEKAKMEEELYKNNSDALQLSVHERLMKSLKITYVPEPEEEEEEEEAVEEIPLLPELTLSMEHEVDAALRPIPPQQTLVNAFNITITRKDMETLASLNWLNDEIINYYFTMIMERGKQDNYPSVHVFNTFFYSRLRDKGYAGVKRWTRKVDIFSHELVLIPVHLGCHWTLATIDMKAKTISYYDSMLGNNKTCLTTLMSYLQDEKEDKKSELLDTTDWELITVKDIPRQLNGSDCGMFTCKFAEYISRRAPITFSQKNMTFFRRLMVYEILHTKILSSPRQ